MSVGKKGISVVSETNLGVYVWQLTNGSFVMDKDFNILSIQAFRGDFKAIEKITKVARNLGLEGSAYFVEGARKISDIEFDIQRERFFSGLTPDPYDIGVYKNDI
jgi:hypothetical protein